MVKLVGVVDRNLIVIGERADLIVTDQVTPSAKSEIGRTGRQ